MNIETAADRMRVALNESLAQLETDRTPQADRVRAIIRRALDDHAATQRQDLEIRVLGEGARMALCDVLRSWTARRLNGAWHEIRTTDSAHHVRELVKDLRIRAHVKVLE